MPSIASKMRCDPISAGEFADDSRRYGIGFVCSSSLTNGCNMVDVDVKSSHFALKYSMCARQVKLLLERSAATSRLREQYRTPQQAVPEQGSGKYCKSSGIILESCPNANCAAKMPLTPIEPI